MLDESGRELPPHRELSTRIFLKTDGKWLMTAFHNTTVATAAPSIQGTWRLVETALRAPGGVDAYTEPEQALGFHATMEQHLDLPFGTVVLGAAITVKKVAVTASGHIVAICYRGRA